MSTLGVNELNSRVRTLRTLYNTAAPINRYRPAELLMSIFAMLPRPNRASESPPRGVVSEGLQSLSLLAHSSPTNHRILGNAGNATRRHSPFGAQVAPLRDDPAAFVQPRAVADSLSLYRCPERLVDAIIPHSHRIIGLEVLIQQKYMVLPALNRLLATAMPILGRLDVTSPYGMILPSDVPLRHLHSLRISPECFIPHVASPSLRDAQLVSRIPGP